MRDADRLTDVALHATAILDVANDPHQAICWRPDPNDLAAMNMAYARVDGLVDRAGIPFDADALDLAVRYLTHYVDEGHTVLVHCAAGLRRAPHVVYAFLRKTGYTPGEAWEQIHAGRPYAIPHKAYVDGVEGWLSQILSGRG
jgi:rhodanese-related sulfurtransferase